MKEIVAVFIGGGLGSLARYGLARSLNTVAGLGFPAGTFLANVLACLILGFVVGLAEQRLVFSPVMRIFWAVGFCGGFSTFSTFSYENLLLFQNGQNGTMLIYLVLSLVLCVIAVFSGQFLAAKL
ncbi:fluoride efflux transporter CrcB [Adhaeribacter sp. BT258]|uniref:Fluoride-specific ion channel FluC n=1 Tax=Adhaeribacter terrigena TaxID=2793070 RepID=A0ABS1C5U6_9BACT|nr:fluoride efflux transporter CrcB [Adhaeribacter terrigena]MBK0404746.1 fluoride efflux transporter CrcB [Adhaeribacter terrigena]